MTRRAPHRIARLVARLAGASLLILAALGPAATAASAADPPTMTARALLQGHARVGSWIAIEVHLVNSGPSVTGELRLQGGSQGGTRYATAVQLDSPSDKTWILHAQPPQQFGPQLEVVLVSGSQILARQKLAVTVHDPGQLIVGVVAENAPKIVGTLSLPAVQNEQPAVIVPLTVADLPARIEAWSALDRLVWQDVDASTLRSDQLTAMRGWLALGGRLVIVGGTGGIGSLGGFPDDLLPFRPTSTVDVAAGSLTALLGTPPADAADVPAMAGNLIRGRTLATSGDRIIAAQAQYGSGSVTILGIDPTAGWVAQAGSSRALWPSLIPGRSDGTVAQTDDSQIVSAVGNLPSLALPPLGGLLLLLFGYIALIGPINYLILRRLDRREWAWITMPILIVGFALGAYAFGSALRGSSVIVNEVGIVRGAPDATEGSAEVYLGVFSPARGTYQVSVLGGPLLSAPISGDVFSGTSASLDILQGDAPGPSRVRDLSVGFGSLRTIRAESQAVVPKVHTELALVDGTLTGTIRNDSAVKLEKPAVVLGANVKVLKDLQPGEQVTVSLALTNQNVFGASLSDRIFGQIFFGNTGATTENARRDQTRHLVVDQLTFDPQFGNFGRLGADGPVLLAWGREAVLDVAVEGQAANRVSNVLYYVPLSMTVKGSVTFSGDLIKGTMTESNAAFFSKDPQMMSFGQGSVTMVYRPIQFDGKLTATHIRLGISCCPDGSVSDAGGTGIEPIPDACLNVQAPAKPPVDCPKALPPDQFDGMPEVELFDRSGDGTWHRLPHLNQGQTYDVADAARYVDPSTGAVRVRFVNDRQDSVNVFLNLSIQGDGPMTDIVVTRGLVKRYPGTLAVAGMDLTVGAGEIFGLVGPNGAGKTTTLRILATLLSATSGHAEVAGIDVRRNPDAARRVLGFMPDVFGVYDDMKVWEYLDFFARCYGIPGSRRRRMIGDLLDLVDLGDKRDAYVQGLSRGMQQRLCLAHTLVHDPDVLLLDEPASGLDPRARVELRELLRELRSLGKTIVISSHILPELEELCTAVAIVDHGQVLAHGRVSEIERRLRFGAVIRVRILTGTSLEEARDHFTLDPRVASATILDDGQIELGFRGDDEASAQLLAAAVAAGIRITSFARAASDLEELFLQVTAQAGQQTQVA